MIALIAEKPSVAKDIARIIGATQKNDGYLSGNGYMVTWAFGHLIQLAMPEAYGVANFRRESLPILPPDFQLIPRQVKAEKGYKADPGVLKQLKVIKEVFDQCDKIIVATDAGREGELIHRYIYNYLGCTKPFVRLWISSLTDRAIREGLDNLQPGERYDNLYLSAKSRSEADWLIGINATQALSVAAGQGVFSLGRVQTPTLVMICNRYLENKNFVPAKFWQLKADTASGKISFTAQSTAKWERQPEAIAALQRVKDAGQLAVKSVERKETSQEPPLLYDLTSLQKEANTKLNFSADKTLSILAEGVAERIIGLYALGNSTREISDWMEENLGNRVSAETISAITDRVLPEIKAWRSRSLESVYPIVWMDAIHYKVMDERGCAVTRAIYNVLALDSEGHKDLLGMYISKNEGANFWLNVLTDLQTRGVCDILIACVDGLKGFPDAIQSVFPDTIVQLCIFHQIRNSVKYVGSKHQKEFMRDLKHVYGAVNKESAATGLLNLEEKWGEKYPIVIKSWQDNWERLTEYFQFTSDIRRMIYTTNTVEGYHRQVRKVTKNKGVFPNDTALEKLVYLAYRNIRKKWTMPIANRAAIAQQLAIKFGDRFKLL